MLTSNAGLWRRLQFFLLQSSSTFQYFSSPLHYIFETTIKIEVLQHGPCCCLAIYLVQHQNHPQNWSEQWTHQQTDVSECQFLENTLRSNPKWAIFSTINIIDSFTQQTLAVWSFADFLPNILRIFLNLFECPFLVGWRQRVGRSCISGRIRKSADSSCSSKSRPCGVGRHPQLCHFYSWLCNVSLRSTYDRW